MKEEEIALKFGIDLESLKKEQTNLCKTLELKDVIDFSDDIKIAAIENLIVNNSIISSVVVGKLEKGKFEVLEEEYFTEKLKFPYISEFRAYRELPAMFGAMDKLEETPDVVLISGEGINHIRLGMASHFSVATGIPSVGVSDISSEDFSVEGEYVFSAKKKVARVLKSKDKSRPLFVSPGNKISLETAYELVKRLIFAPHKLPEPMHLAHKYAKEVRKELGV